MRSGQCEFEPVLNSVSYLTFDTDDDPSASAAGEDLEPPSATPVRGRTGRCGLIVRICTEIRRSG